MRSKQRQDAGHFLDLLKRLAEVSALLGGGLFLIGWSYLYGYYKAFGLSPGELGLSFDNVLVHSIPVIRNTVFEVSAALVCVGLFLADSFKSASNLMHRSGFILLVALAGAIFSSDYASRVGRENARRDATLETSTLPYVTFESSSLPSMEPTSACATDSGEYRLLLRSGGQVFVVLPIDSPDLSFGLNIRVCGYRDSGINVMRLQVGVH